MKGFFEFKDGYYLLPADKIPKLFPQRKIDANKGNFGHVLVVGGDYGMGGAVIMAAQAASRSGAGRVTVLTRPEHWTALLTNAPNIMMAQGNLEEIIANKTVVVLGPGLGKSDWSRKLFNFFIKSDLPKVIDADALNLLSESTEKYNLTNAVLTPHPLEAARLLGVNVNEIQNNRKAAIEKIHQKYRAIMVLKGHNSLVLGEKLYLCPYGNPGMATAGMGDVLTGIIGGLIAQKMEIEQAAILGVSIHAAAADRVSSLQGAIGMIPQDIINNIPFIIN
jgi:hydroxyethylthiazole kinase-like uncharacterized protein yjeF